MDINDGAGFPGYITLYVYHTLLLFIIFYIVVMLYMYIVKSVKVLYKTRFHLLKITPKWIINESLQMYVPKLK